VDDVNHIVVIGCSAGGLTALKALLSTLTAGFPAPIVLVQHRGRDREMLFEEVLQPYCVLHVMPAVDKIQMRAGNLYVAPADYHVFVEDHDHLALSQDEKVNFSRPSVDVLFESAAEAFGSHVSAIVLSGANEDGARGARRIAANGGCVYVQEPASAEVKTMPEAALREVPESLVQTAETIFPHIAGRIEINP